MSRQTRPGAVSTLWDPDRHSALADKAWDAVRARAWLQTWARAALDTWARDQGWPLHPRDASDFGESPPDQVYSLYSGQAGVWLALQRLSEAGYGQLPASPAEIFAQVHAGYCQAPDTGERVPSWFLGESSLLAARWLAQPDPDLADALEAMLFANRANPTREALWGAPGTMIAALFLHERTGLPRWAELFRDSVAAVWDSWHQDPLTGVWYWEQDMYGRRSHYLGAGHGWAGNLYPLWRGAGRLDPARRSALRERTLTGLRTFALQDGPLANWKPEPESQKMLVQWCHGAPGIITSLRHADLPEADCLLAAGGELILAAGPLAKGVGLCHGTDGNGMALLALHARSGDTRWLDAARRFAMWSIHQSEQGFRTHGQWRYSLWTGDAGLACFLLDCLAGASQGMPGLDYF